MDTLQIARKVVQNQKDMDFKCTLSAYDSKENCDALTAESILSLSSRELRYILSQHIKSEEVFDGLRLQKINVKERLHSLAEEICLQESTIINLHELIPEELEDLAEQLDGLDAHDSDEREMAKDIITEVIDGTYTFHFEIESNGFLLTEDEEAKIHLTKAEALACLVQNSVLVIDPALFPDEEITSKDMDKCLCNFLLKEKAKETAYIFSGVSSELDNYIKNRVTFIKYIIEGKITEDKIKKCEVEFFGDEASISFNQFGDWYDEME
ncbi:MAG: hypothetical protein K5675_07460 [Lachnospiraceae bacterium]|nr:hypothetical protein [Lachnospiraceae bacterium]